MLIEAYQDLKYLLNRGYRKSVALNFIANHYRLDKNERYFLARCVFPDEWIAEVREKLLRPEDLRGKILAIDGFNVLITLESLLDGKAILCEDRLVRDLEYQGRYRLNENTKTLIELIANILANLKPGKVVVFYGKNVPKSGQVKRLTEEALLHRGIEGEVHLVKSPDFELKSFEAVATADTGVIAKVSHVVDLPGAIGKNVGITPLELSEILKNPQLLES